MKKTIEDLLVAATPKRSASRAFSNKVMQRVRASAEPKPRMWTQLGKFRKAHGLAFALLSIVALCLVSGVVYAAAVFAPDLIRIDKKEVNRRGETEYVAEAFAACQSRSRGISVGHFILRPTAPKLSDEEATTILKAQCELRIVDDSVSKTWPTYGTNPEWKDGDTIFYARANIMGTVLNVSDTEVTLAVSGNELPVHYTAPPEVTIQVLENGELVARDRVQPGDVVMAVVRVAQIYHPHSPGEGEIPQVVGVIGLIKFDLPLAYYFEKQDYLYEAVPCIGNEHEWCTTGSRVAFDVFPRASEGARNPDLLDEPNLKSHEIMGEVTELGGRTMTLKSYSGELYRISINENAFSSFNTSPSASFEKLAVGSMVSALYFQPEGSDVHRIEPSHIMQIMLLSDSDPKSLR